MKQQISEFQNPTKNPNPSIPDLMLNILHYSSEIQEGVSVDMVKHKFNISNAKSEHQLGKLKEDELIDYGLLSIDQDIPYVPTQKGLDLLNKNGLI